jgi:hypothetical protein
MGVVTGLTVGLLDRVVGMGGPECGIERVAALTDPGTGSLEQAFVL